MMFDVRGEYNGGKIKEQKDPVGPCYFKGVGHDKLRWAPDSLDVCVDSIMGTGHGWRRGLKVEHELFVDEWWGTEWKEL